MNLSRKSIILILAAVAITTAWPATAFAEEAEEAEEDLSVYSDAELVAMTMREYQTRYQYIDVWKGEDAANDVGWPSVVECANLVTPAYPPDDWYEYELLPENDPSKTRAASIVSALVGTFFESNCVTLDPLFSHFLHDDFWDLHGTSEVPTVYVASDFATLYDYYISGVDSTNYRAALEEVWRVITDQLLVVYLIFDARDPLTSFTQESKAWGYGHAWSECDPPGACDEAKAGAGLDGSYIWGSVIGDLGVVEMTDLNIESLPPMFSARKEVVRRKFFVDLTDHTGTADLYLAISPEEDGWSSDYNMAGLRKWDDRWQLWQGSIDTGGQWESPYLANFDPEWTTNCPIGGTRVGWRFEDDDSDLIDWWWLMLVRAVFECGSDAGIIVDAGPDETIYKSRDPYTVYSAHDDCPDAFGETVDANIPAPYSATPQSGESQVTLATYARVLNEYDTKAASFTVGGWDGNGTQINDPNTVICLSSGDVKFSVAGGKGATTITCKVVFYRQAQLMAGGYSTRRAETEITFDVVGNHFNCCSKDDGEHPNPETVFEEPQITKHANGDVEIYFPEPDEAYIFEYPRCGFLRGITLEEYDSAQNSITVYGTNDQSSEDDVTFESAVVIRLGGYLGYVYEVPSTWWAETDPFGSGTFRYLVDATDHMIEIATYDETSGNRTGTQNAQDPDNRYTEYIYGDPNNPDSVTQIIIHGDIDGENESRIYNVTYDGDGNITGMGGLSCSSCGGGPGGGSYDYDEDGNHIGTMDADGNTTMSYEYDEDGNLTQVNLGSTTTGETQQTISRTTTEDGDRTDIRSYTSTSSYEVRRIETTFSREEDSENETSTHTRTTTTTRFGNLDEDPDNPVGEIFVEISKYIVVNELTSGDVLTETTIVIPPLGDPSGTGIRRESTMTYGDGTKTLTVKQYDSSGNEITVSTENYEQFLDDTDWRITSSTRNGGTTQYSYSSDPNHNTETVTMPEVTSSDGISDQQQLVTKTYYDIDNGRLDKEEKYNYTTKFQTTTYEYDDFGNLTKQTVTDEVASKSLVTEYAYNGFNEQVLMKSSSGVVSGKEYDSKGRGISEFVLADPADVTFGSGFNYETHYKDKIDTDPYSLISQTRYHYHEGDNPEGNYVKGRLRYIKKVKEDGGFDFAAEDDAAVSWVVTEFKYNLYGRRISVIEDQTDAALKTNYEYDIQGRVKKTTLPNGKWTETHRDGRGMVKMQIVGHDNMEDENDWLVTLFYYDARGNLSEKVTPDSVSTVYKYDDFDRLVMVRKGL